MGNNCVNNRLSMKFNQKILFCLLALLLVMPHAQSQPAKESPLLSDPLRTALELITKERYVSALQILEEIARESPPHSPLQVEAAYYQTVCLLETGNKSGKKQLEAFLDENPGSPHHSDAYFRLGNQEFMAKHYGKALTNYQQIDEKALSQIQRETFLFNSGYCNLEADETTKAKAFFAKLKDSGSQYEESASYYWAHVNYLEGDYDTALEELESLSNSPQFAEIIPFYQTQIYFQKREYKKVIEVGASLMETASDDRKPELAKIIGDAYYYEQNFEAALPYLERYHKAVPKAMPEAHYITGYCYYKSGKYDLAAINFERATIDNKAIAQNAWYHLADAYLKTGNKQKAMLAFQKASELDTDEVIKEDALFQYAKITYELDYSPFNEAIKAFDKYISLYPNAERNDIAYDYLVKVFMTTRNYKDALTSLDKIKVKNAAIKKAYQRVAYYRALEMFRNQQYEEAIEMFGQSLQYKQYDTKLNALALYWRAEAFFRQGNKAAALADYKKFQQVPGAIRLNEYSLSDYSMGYAHFEGDNFAMAEKHFGEFIISPGRAEERYIADAHNRLGDCFYIRRDFDKALQQYRKAYTIGRYDADYALYQEAFCYGLQHKHNVKINTLDKLRQQFPKSTYIDDALFQTGKAWERLNNQKNAAASYRTLLTNHNMSPLHSKVLLQLGLIEFNRNNYTQSLAYYKQVVEQHQGTPEYRAALAGIRNNYVEQNNISGYLDYTKSLGQMETPSEMEQDSLNYIAAEKLFMAGDKKATQAFANYLANFPTGKYSLNAYYYKAEMHYRNQEKKEALEAYDQVLSRPDNLFTVSTLEKACGLAYEAEAWQKALHYYQWLGRNRDNTRNQMLSLAGSLRCYYQLEQFDAVTQTSWKIRNTDKVPPELAREAHYLAAKAYHKMNEPTKALTLWRSLATDTKSQVGAEAKYRVCENYFANQKWQETEDEVMDYIEKNTTHQYWLAKSFLLLAQVYEAKNDAFQAKYTLQSIIENYGEPEDGIIDEAEKLLYALEQKEANAPSTGAPEGVEN